MFIRNIHLKNVRIHKNISVDFSPNTTIITGKNGSGKTSILEAVYISLTGKSYKGSLDDVLQKDSDILTIESHIDDNTYIVKYDGLKNKKEIHINDKNYSIFPRTKKIPVVLFEPEHMRLLTGSPSIRREYIDGILSQIDSVYKVKLSRYEKALAQRNKLLKNNIQNKEQYFSWNIILSESAEYIIQKRIEMIAGIQDGLEDVYRNISQTKDKISIKYSEKDRTKQEILKNLEDSISKDLLLKHTSLGPHRHDVGFFINNTPAAQSASRGETRSVVLALKILESNILEDYFNAKPIMLLDDVFSELDEDRQRSIILRQANQTIITTTHNSYRGVKQIKL